ncbi:MAG: Xaa-Pro peptidase family protein [Actinobacteria bacterium]|jgi:Xaa-Pro dipeptidase|nr:Xaa-Pro peptidase family protein [Actinomycetota bacterium]MCL6095157.1 Xaa-Pro peptidase family protein [Actinomycetota bacterium]
MAWEVDVEKLERVRARMAEEDLDAIVARAPDNVLYLTNYWCMKGYDAVVFPREGDPTLIVIAPQLADAERMSWTKDIRLFDGYDPSDPRPPTDRSLDLCLSVLKERGLDRRIGLELSQGVQGIDRMVGEPTVYSKPWFDAFAAGCREVVDASPLLASTRMIKTSQELERMKLANELATLGLQHVKELLVPGMRCSEAGAAFEGFVHANGVGYKNKVEMARAFTLVWSGPGIRTFTATSDMPVYEHEPTLFEIWVCADGYWTDLTKNLCPGELDPRYDELLDMLLGVYHEAVGIARAGARIGELDRLMRQRIAEAGYPGQPSHAVAHGVGARAHEPPFAHQAAEGVMQAGMVFAIEPGVYWEGGGGLRLEDDYLITADEPERLCEFPDDFRTL